MSTKHSTLRMKSFIALLIVLPIAWTIGGIYIAAHSPQRSFDLNFLISINIISDDLIYFTLETVNLVYGCLLGYLIPIILTRKGMSVKTNPISNVTPLILFGALLSWGLVTILRTNWGVPNEVLQSFHETFMYKLKVFCIAIYIVPFFFAYSIGLIVTRVKQSKIASIDNQLSPIPPPAPATTGEVVGAPIPLEAVPVPPVEGGGR